MDNYVIMFLFTLLSPIITALINNIGQFLSNQSPIIYDKVSSRLQKKVNSIFIKVSKTKLKNHGWIYDGSFYDTIIIDSVVDYLHINGLYSTSMKCHLGTSNASDSSMSNRRINLMPTTDIVYGDFTYSYSEAFNNEGDKLTIILRVSSNLPTKDISTHISKIYVDYSSKVFDRVIDSQFLYKLADENLIFRKYPINNLMTFDKMNFPERDKIIEMLDKLTNNEINKFTLLLHSPPGMGKTSIIKSIANKMNYCIIEIKLSMIKSDIDLINIFHEKHITHYHNNDSSGNKQYDKIPLNRRIYILEDIDAETDIIHKRDGEKKEDKKDDSLKEVLESIVESKKSKTETKNDEVKPNEKKPPLTLSGVLNALDGVLEINGAILVMTTNFPEKLDAALIRPGRITMNIELRKMLYIDAIAHIRRYFPMANISPDIIPDYSITPAELESFCQISTSLEELLKLIKNKV